MLELSPQERITATIFHGVPVELVGVERGDWSLDGAVIGGLLNGTYDAVIDLLAVTRERVEAGVQFTTPILAVTSSIVSRSDGSSVSENALGIITDQFHASVAWPLIMSFVVIFLLFIARHHRNIGYSNFTFIREMIPGSNTSGFPAGNRALLMTASLLSLVIAVVYQVTLAQSLMIVPPVDEEAIAFGHVRDVHDGRATFVTDTISIMLSKLLDGDDTFSRAVQTAVQQTPWRIETDDERRSELILDGEHISLREDIVQFENLEALAYPQCMDYQVTPVPITNLNWMAIGASTRLSAERMTVLNALITTRFETITQRLGHFHHPDAICAEHFKRKEGNHLKYNHLTVNKLRGGFYMIAMAAGAAAVALVGELVVNFRQKRRDDSPTQHDAVVDFRRTSTSTTLTFDATYLVRREDCAREIHKLLAMTFARQPIIRQSSESLKI